MFIAIDGNATGKAIEMMIFENDLEGLEVFSKRILSAVNGISDWITAHSGKIIMAGGDNILAQMDADICRELVGKIDEFSIDQYTFSVATSETAQGAYCGLKYAKATGKRMINVVFGESGTMQFENIM